MNHYSSEGHVRHGGHFFALFAVLALLCAPVMRAQWTQVWGGPFNGSAGTTYNHSDWWNNVQDNTGNIWGDGTIQSTSDSLSNVYLDGNGNLIIAMTYNPNPGSGQTNYTSARLTSTFNAGPYGRFDARIQNPGALGMGAAFWALGENAYAPSHGPGSSSPSTSGGVPWPWCGELDMMEIQAKTDQHNGSTVHGGETDSQTSYEYGGISATQNLTASATFDNGFHVFATQWAPYHLQYFLDGTQYGDVSLWNIGVTDQWEMNQAINVILSSGVGGNGGTPNGQGFPSNLVINYVNYSQWSAGAPAPVTALTATAASSNSVDLLWDASSTSGVTYDIYASTAANTPPSLATLVAQQVSATSYTQTGLQSNTTYYYTVVSANWGGESSAATASAKTQAPGNSTGIQLSAGGYAVGTFMTSNFVLGGNTNFHFAAGPPSAPVAVDTSLVSDPAPQLVYDTERWGPAAWTITGLNPKGGYDVRLHFVEFAHTAAGQRNFNVSINSEQVLTNFDIFATAGAADKAVAEEFYTQADENGIIEIETSLGTTGAVDLNPTINAIEVIPTTGSNPVGARPGTTTALSINSGGGAVSNSGGGDNSFIADEDNNGGDTATSTNTITVAGVTNAAPMAVYQSQRYVPFTYVLTGLVADATYNVRMHFAETYWTASGKRIFNVVLNGQQVLTGLDVYATVGANKALVEQFSTQADMYGQIIVQLVYDGADQPMISGLEALETSSGCSAAPSVPGTPSATATSSSTISLSWGASTAGSGCTVSYDVFRSTTPGFTPGSGNQIASGVTSTSYGDSGLTASTAYYYKVESSDSAGTSAASGQGSAATQASSCSAAPSVPGTPSATATSSSAINLSWGASTAGSGCTVSYKVFRSTTSGFTPGSGNQIASGVTSTSYGDTGLTASTTYYYKVESSDSAGTSAASAQAQATTQSGSGGGDFIAIACGGPAESNSGGRDASFVADEDFSGGGDGQSTTNSINLSQPGANAAPQGVYQHERNGTMTYTIPGMTPNSQHTVLLHFSELYWSAAGKRVFNVSINGTRVLTNLDIYATVGKFAALVETFTATANSSGQIVISYTNGTADQPDAAGIEIR